MVRRAFTFFRKLVVLSSFVQVRFGEVEEVGIELIPETG